MGKEWHISWLVFVLIVLGLLIGLAPALLWRGRRPAYLSALCAVFGVALAFLWARDIRRREDVDLDLAFESRARRLLLEWGISAGAGGIALDFRTFRDSRPVGANARLERPLIPDNRPEIVWRWQENLRSKFPGTVSPDGRPAHWGFGVLNHPFPTGIPGQTIHLTRIWFPDWSAIFVLSIPPAIWLLRRPSRLRKRCSAENLCTKCGYSLNGLTEPVRCPECGTPKPAPPAGSKLSTATETQGKPA